MQLSRGVEWAVHTCLNLSWIGTDEGVSSARLAAFYDLPPAYLNKQLQLLVKAGILTSTAGRLGGFSLARRLDEVTLLDVVIAIDGPVEIFRCEQILKNGPGGSPSVDYRSTCLVSGAMRKAEMAWRKELTGTSLADLREQVMRSFPDTPEMTRGRFRELA